MVYVFTCREETGDWCHTDEIGWNRLGWNRLTTSYRRDTERVPAETRSGTIGNQEHVDDPDARDAPETSIHEPS